MRISDWSSDVCSSDLPHHDAVRASGGGGTPRGGGGHVGGLRSKLMASASGLTTRTVAGRAGAEHQRADFAAADAAGLAAAAVDKQFLLEVPGCAIGTEEIAQGGAAALDRFGQHRSEEHTSELQSLMRI